MTPKEKAFNLTDNCMMRIIFGIKENIEADTLNSAKQLATFCVQEIINANPHSNPLNTNPTSTMEYWLDVKKEIQKL